jgi:hypothetical protein
MKKLFFFVLILLIPLASPVSLDSMSPLPSAKAFDDNWEKVPQNTQKQKFDYMSSILSRNTKPLGLKENVTLRKWLNQPSIKWAMRSGRRHILN